MELVFLHEHPAFGTFLHTVANQLQIKPCLVEKDYWIMHVLRTLKQDYSFTLKGGTSLSKGFRFSGRFSEEVGLVIEPPDHYRHPVTIDSNKPAAILSRMNFFDWLAADMVIPGITTIERDEDFDDNSFYRSAGIRLSYHHLTKSEGSMRDGILLDIGLGQPMPAESKPISSWLYDGVREKTNGAVIDNRVANIRCAHPGLILVEKLKTIIRQFREEITIPGRCCSTTEHYYDVYALLGNERVQHFLTEPFFAPHRQSLQRGSDGIMPVCEHPAFRLDDPGKLADYEARYQATNILYYLGQPAFPELLARIRADLHGL